MPSSSLKSLRDTARLWASLGISVIPIKPDASKGPAVRTWKEWQERIITDEEIDRHFKPGIGIGIIGGEVSGNLEILDFDVPKDEDGNVIGECIFDAWGDCLEIDALELIGSMPTIRTPGGGIHLYYRCESLEGNKKLAMKLNPPGTIPPLSVIVETRGRGGYVLAPGCPPECHPTGKTYEILSGSIDGGGIPTITAEQRNALFAVARSFDESDIAQREARRADPSQHPAVARDGNRPGDDYNRRALWSEILEPHGWTFGYHRRHDGAQCWRRPGKPERERGISATIREFDGMELFHSFSSNSDPLPHDESITKFTAYTLLEHGGNYEAAARALGKSGYGDQARRIIDLDSVVDGRRDDSVPWADGHRFENVNTRVISDKFGDEEAPHDLPFSEDDAPGLGASILHEEVDPLEAQLFNDEEKLEAEEGTRKKKQKLKKRQVEMEKGPAYIVWRDHGDEPRRFLTANGQIKTRVDKPRDTAWFIINDKFSHHDDIRSLHYQHGEFMLWNGERYRRLKLEDVRPQISNYLTYFAEYKGEDEDGNIIYEAFKVRKQRVDEMMTTIKDMAHIDGEIHDPSWLCDVKEGQDLPDPREIVCCKNGLLDVQNRQLLESTPALYSFNSTGILYKPNASRPGAWLDFLESTLDEESQILLQEFFGYCLVQDTRLQKMLMVVGKPGSGKGTAINVLQWLIGDASYCSMDFDRIGSNFALSVALGKSLMIFPDARQGYNLDSKGVVGTLLSITGEDDLLIDRKNMKPVTQKLNTRIVVVSNDVINLSDASGALNRRMLWIKFPGFVGILDPNLKRRLKKELSGILNWAIEGWHKVRSTGRFTQPESAKDFIEAFQEQASPIKKFIDDMCAVGQEQESSTGDIFRYWNIWRKVNGYRGTQSQAAFGKQLLSADMSIHKTRIRKDGQRLQLYLGIGLDRKKIEEFVSGSVGEKQWNRARDEFIKQTDADIIDIFEWMDKNKKTDKQ